MKNIIHYQKKEGKSNSYAITQTSFSAQKPRTPPKQIVQQKITKTHQQLKCIPQCLNPEHILYLHLSHNRIATLKGIQSFLNLISLNISYNQLSEIEELLIIPNKTSLRHIGLKKNSFQFGYQDYAVAMLPNLEKIDDIKLTGIDKKLIKKQAMEISNCLIGFQEFSNQIILQLQQKNKSIQNIVSYLTIEKLSKIYFKTNEEELNRMKIEKIIEVCRSILSVLVEQSKNKCFLTANYVQETKRSFKKIMDEILLHYSLRNDKKLINCLKTESISKKISLQASFGRLGLWRQATGLDPQFQTCAGGYLFDNLLNFNAGQYIEKCDQQQLKSHPISLYANFENKPNSLYGDGVNRWSSILNAAKRQQQNFEENFFEKIPMFIFQKSYIQVILEIMMKKIGDLLNLYHQNVNFNKENESYHQNIEKEEQKEQKEQNHEQIADNQSLLSFGCRPTIKNEESFFNFNAKEQKIDINLNKYSIYQINLIYKVLRIFKKHTKRRKTIPKLR